MQDENHAINIGQRIREARRNYGYTQSEVSQATEVSQPMVCAAEQGRFVVFPPSVSKVLSQLGLSVEVIITENKGQ